MNHRIHSLLGLLGLLTMTFWITPSAAEVPSAREWSNTVQAFREQILNPLSEHFSEQECVSDLKPYMTEVSRLTREVRPSIDEKLFLLIREAVFNVTEDLSPYQGVIDCQTADWWQLIRFFNRKPSGVHGQRVCPCEIAV